MVGVGGEVVSRGISRGEGYRGLCLEKLLIANNRRRKKEGEEEEGEREGELEAYLDLNIFYLVNG